MKTQTGKVVDVECSGACGSLDPTVIDDDAMAFYTQGACWLLAWHLRALTGWPLAFIGVLDGVDEVFWVHAGVKMPDGRFVDVYGPHDRFRAEMEWDSSNSRLRFEDEAEVLVHGVDFSTVPDLELDDVDPATHEVALAHARVLLRAHHLDRAIRATELASV